MKPNERVSENRRRAHEAASRPWPPPDYNAEAALMAYGRCHFCGGPMYPRLTEPEPGVFHFGNHCVNESGGPA